MAKTCIKKDLKKLENEIEDLIMLEDSAHGTLCAIHKTIHSTDNFPCSKHKMLRICPAPKAYNSVHTRIPVSRSRKKSRSNSPCYERPKIYRALSANDPNRKYHCTRHHVYCRLEKSKTARPEYCSTKHVNVEKTNSCPEKMCCYHSNTNCHQTCTITSRSSIEFDQFAQNLMNTDEVVNELRGEIQKVKHQLHHMSQQKLAASAKSKIPCLVKGPSSTQDDYNESQISKLRNENNRLKREIEAKRKLLEKSKNDVSRAKDILADYEKKVGLLHVQALKSSKVMKQNKEQFSRILKEKEEKIKTMKEANDAMRRIIKEKEKFLHEREKEAQILNESINTLKKAFDEACEKCTMLTETNQNFLASIDMLRSQLMNSSSEVDNQKETIQALEEKICELNCICKKVVSRTKKQKDSYESLIKDNEEEQMKMSKKISELSEKIEEAEQNKKSLDEIQCKCEELQQKIREYEAFSEKCKTLEEECKKHHEELAKSEAEFQKERREMERLIDELTTVVKENKVTIQQMCEINKQQENIINSQSMALLTKEEQLKLMEKESEESKMKSQQLEEEVQQLRRSLSEPCSKEACLCISKELSQIKNALNTEKDTHLLKEKIIEDQSQTILNLQKQVREKMIELSQAQNDTKYLEDEINKINEKLIRKHQELDREVDEKENLIEKLRILECQKNQLSEEIGDFEEMLHQFKQTCGDNEKQQIILRNLEKQIDEQRRIWEKEKESMAKEKKKAICAAKFATQKLLDTVEDFQRQVDAQKKVQLLLTKMLHEKDEQLQAVKSKISNINHITKDVKGSEENDSMKELFFRNTLENYMTSEVNTNTSIYSSCSSCCKRPECPMKHGKSCRFDKFHGKAGEKACLEPCPNAKDIVRVLSNSIHKIQEEPSRDLS